jgi:hypothetical protein
MNRHNFHEGVLMKKNPEKKTVFVIVIESFRQEKQAKLLAESIRSFGEELGNAPIWMFSPSPAERLVKDAERLAASVFPLKIPAGISNYLFGARVYACAEAERMASADFGSLVSIDPSCLVVKSPLLFELGDDADAAVRPVHIRNVGSPAEGPPDGYWTGIFRAVGVEDIPTTVESFVDGERIRSYFNTHAFAVNLQKGLMKKWLELFTNLVEDEEFQEKYCRDERHRIFLFQSVLSALLASRVDERRLRILPPDYNYPYNLHGEVPKDRKALALNDLTCLTYEGRSLVPRDVTDINLREPLKPWLQERINLTVPA